MTLTRTKGIEVVKFAARHNALIEQKKFKTFTRFIVNTVDGILAFRINSKTEIKPSKQYQNKMNSYSKIKLKGYQA